MWFLAQKQSQRDKRLKYDIRVKNKIVNNKNTKCQSDKGIVCNLVVCM